MRDRKSSAQGRRIEDRKGYQEIKPELVAMARRLARKNPKTKKTRSLREIAAELVAAGYVTTNGQPFSPTQVKRLLGR